MNRRIVVSLLRQRLRLYAGERQLSEWVVSTAANGPGERNGSECTPRGLHRIRARIGAGQPPGAVFVGRRPTGEIWTPALAAAEPGRDWILSRILWLCGCEPGYNRHGDVDSMRRYIYIHGTPEEDRLGRPVSHGCVRMSNAGIIELFDAVPAGCPVQLIAGDFDD